MQNNNVFSSVSSKNNHLTLQDEKYITEYLRNRYGIKYPFESLAMQTKESTK